MIIIIINKKLSKSIYTNECFINTSIYYVDKKGLFYCQYLFGVRTKYFDHSCHCKHNKHTISAMGDFFLLRFSRASCICARGFTLKSEIKFCIKMIWTRTERLKLHNNGNNKWWKRFILHLKHFAIAIQIDVDLKLT